MKKGAKNQTVFTGIEETCSILSSILETAYLLHSPANAERLLTALNDALKSEGKPLSLAVLRAGWNSMAKQREAVFHPHFVEDLSYRVQTEHKIALRTLILVNEILRDPFQGTGKPEPFKYLTPNTWSRRLTQEHRIEYLVQEGRIVFLQARHHDS